jgi:hypothetical protein
MNVIQDVLKATFGREPDNNAPPVFIEFTRESLNDYKNTENNVSHEMIRLFLFLLPYYQSKTKDVVVLQDIYPINEKQSLCNVVRATIMEDGVNKVVVVVHQPVIDDPDFDHVYAIVICKKERRIEFRDEGFSADAILAMKGLAKALVKEIAGAGVNIWGPN